MPPIVVQTSHLSIAQQLCSWSSYVLECLVYAVVDVPDFPEGSLWSSKWCLDCGWQLPAIEQKGIQATSMEHSMAFSADLLGGMRRCALPDTVTNGLGNRYKLTPHKPSMYTLCIGWV